MSREIDCGGQGTEEWLKARLGVPSASNFSKVVTTINQPLNNIISIQ